MSLLNNRSILTPVLFAVILPTLIGLFKPGWLDIVGELFFWAAFFTVPIVVVGIVYTWTRSEDSILNIIGRFVRPIPPGMIYGSDLKTTGLPKVTIGLILANAFLYTYVPLDIVVHLCLLPKELPSLPHLLATTVTCAFFHANFSHLFGNMVFLWALGATLESRLGPERFAAAYLACTLICNFVCLNLLLFQVWLDNDPDLQNTFHSLGASGAIAGLMGLFVIRCHFARLSLSLPILFNPIFSVPVRINGLLLIGIFFAMDLSGSIEMLAGDEGRINYWAHLGGFAGGLAVAFAFGLHKDAEPEAQQAKAARLVNLMNLALLMNA
jgi:membrane associated rhomboid family serine protease